MGFPAGSVGKESACNAEDLGLILGLGRSPGEGNGNPLQYSCLEIYKHRGAWWATVHEAAKESDTTEQPLSLAFLLLPASRQMQCLEAQKPTSDWADNSHRLRVVPVGARRQLGLWVFDDFLGWL